MKPISVILIFSSIYYCLGCYNTNLIKQDNENYKTVEKFITENSDRDIYVITRDSEKFYFPAHSYGIKNNVFQGRGRKYNQGVRKFGEYEITIDVPKIQQVEYDEFSVKKTIFLSVALLTTSFVIIGMIAMGEAAGSIKREL